MNRYIIQYHSKTRVALAKRDKQQTFPLCQWVFKYPGLQNYELMIVLKDNLKKTDSIQLHTGLNIISDIKAGSEEEARHVSKNFVETLLTLISFSTVTYCDSSILVSVISITDGESHPFQYYVYPFEEQEILNSLIHIDESTFGRIFDAYHKSSYKPRTLRALMWLRKGIGEEDAVDKFVSYWVGLEVIKHVLSPEKVNTNKEWEKVEEVFTKKLNFKGFGKIKEDGRNGLLHGFRQLDGNYMKEIGGYVEPIRKTLIICIGSVLGLKDNTLLTITNKVPHKIENARWSIMKGNLKNLPNEFSELVKNYPALDAEVIKKQYAIDQEGHLTVKSKIDHHFSSGSDIKWELGEIEQWAKEDSGIQGITSGEFDVDKANKSSSD